MKKLISLALVIVMMMSLGITAFAAEEVLNDVGTCKQDVTGTYVAGTTGGTVYHVTVEWTAMDFTYHAVQEPVWNPETLTYSKCEDAYWEGTGTITVTNRSNAKISAVPSYETAEAYPDAGMTFSTEKLKLATAELGTAQTGTITVTPTGSLPAGTEGKTIGTITVTIAADPDVTLAEAQALHREVGTYTSAYTGAHTQERVDLETANSTLGAEIDRYPNNPAEYQSGLNAQYERVLKQYTNFKNMG